MRNVLAPFPPLARVWNSCGGALPGLSRYLELRPGYPRFRTVPLAIQITGQFRQILRDPGCELRIIATNADVNCSAALLHTHDHTRRPSHPGYEDPCV